MDQHVTARNWLIGYYIFNYEQNGQDRAKYGDRLVDCIAEQLNDNGLSGRNLKLFRQFYLSFPNLYESITKFLVAHDQIVQSLITQLQLISSQQDKIVQSVIAQINMYRNYYRDNFMAPGDNLPIGILLCTKSGKEMVKYATEGIDSNLYIQEYSLHLPT